MNLPSEFDLVNSPLEGKNLIEASAGTGKTYTIAGLYVRFLIERKLPVKTVLVVTFTKAATHELNSRIRSRLNDARKAFANGKPADDFLAGLLQKFPDKDGTLAILNRALLEFDEAAIYTIDSFCNRVLQEHAFESGGLFDTELVSEQTDLLEQVVQDFWRKRLYRESRAFVNYTLGKINLGTLFSLIENMVRRLDIEVLPDVTIDDPSTAQRDLADSFKQLAPAWFASRDEVWEILRSSQTINRRLYAARYLSGWFREMDAYCSATEPELTVFDKFERFTQSQLIEATKPGCEEATPAHPFFEVCERHWQNIKALCDQYDRRLYALKKELIVEARNELLKRKREKNISFFDDLLINLYTALQKPGEKLTAAVREKFKVALIDEFQDTDPTQYEVFKKIFDHEGSSLFLIGDPKQAIYGFRGADIFAYIRAKKETAQQYTLLENYRSTAKLLEGFNAIFGNVAELPFVFEQIPYYHASMPPNPIHENLSMPDNDERPLRLWFVDTEQLNQGRKLNRADGRRIIIESTIAEIKRLINLGREGKACVDDRPISEKDIAVLVRAREEARQLQEELTRHGVHSVLYSAISVFQSPEATELERVLTAVSQPKRLRFLKAALATEILGIDAKMLFELDQDERLLESWFDKLAVYHRLWLDHGFMRMFRELLTTENIIPRLMSTPNGERRATNLLHLSEILNEVSIQNKLGTTGLLKWLSEHRLSKAAPAEEHQLRLESDENAIKLVTMHMSKGLQYPVVFCPFTWSGATLWNPKSLNYHDEEKDWAYTVNLDVQDAKSRALAQKEELAENLRLMYVALTRAQLRCYLVWGRISDWASSAPAYLLHQKMFLEQTDPVNSLTAQLGACRDHDLQKDLQNLVAKAGGAIALNAMPALTTARLDASRDIPAKLTSRVFSASIDSTHRISSYSGLITSHPHRLEEGDYDIGIRQPLFPAAAAQADFASFTNFPAGPKTGLFVHEVFEYLDYTETDQTVIEGLIETRLRSYGFESQWQGAIFGMVHNVLQQELSLNGAAFSLSQISNEARLNEMQFYFPVSLLSPDKLRDLFRDTAPGELPETFLERLDELTFATFKGFMKGFIDLIFKFEGRYYLIDWKSNYLGSQPQDYEEQALATAMADNFYFLQYHIYTLALHRFLQQRLPAYDYESHFGGVFYVFLRGVDRGTEQPLGVYRDRPSEKLIQQLAQIIPD